MPKVDECGGEDLGLHALGGKNCFPPLLKFMLGCSQCMASPMRIDKGSLEQKEQALDHPIKTAFWPRVILEQDLGSQPDLPKSWPTRYVFISKET